MKSVNDEPKYKNGLVVHPVQHPQWDLVIDSYCQRIYYCYRQGDAAKKMLVYFERELIPPLSVI